MSDLDTQWWMERVKDARGEGERMRVLWLCIRQALIIAIGGIEDYLGLERSIMPRHKR